MQTTDQTLLHEITKQTSATFSYKCGCNLRWNRNLKGIHKGKPNNILGNVKKKWTGAEGRERKVSKEGRAMYLSCVTQSLGNGDLHLPAHCLSRHMREAQCALCVVFHHFFQYFLIEPKPPCGTLTIPFTLLLSCLFSRLVIISQAPRVGSLSSFLRNDYLQTCYVKSYDIAHNTQDLSNRPPWKILVSTT